MDYISEKDVENYNIERISYKKYKETYVENKVVWDSYDATDKTIEVATGPRTKSIEEKASTQLEKTKEAYKLFFKELNRLLDIFKNVKVSESLLERFNRFYNRLPKSLINYIEKKEV